MLKILILDDEAAAGNLLRLLLERHISLPRKVEVFTSPEEALARIPVFQPSLLLLDIEMPGMNGFDFLGQAAAWTFDVIFTTAYDKYAIKAIRFSALDYLLKPVDILELQNAVNRHIVKKDYQGSEQQQQLVGNLLNNLQQPVAAFKLAVSVKEGVFLFDTAEIICLEGINNYTKLSFTRQKPLLAARTLKEYEELLYDHGFIRVHKSFLVNKMHIRSMDHNGNLKLSNDLIVPVSRRKRTDVLALFDPVAGKK